MLKLGRYPLKKIQSSHLKTKKYIQRSLWPVPGSQIVGMTRWKACKNMSAWISEKGSGGVLFSCSPFLISISWTDYLGAWNKQGFFFHHVHPQEKVYLTLASLVYVFNFFRMLLGISTIVFYIFILVSYFRMRSEYALQNIPWKSENKIRPSLQLPHFHEQGWKRQQIKKPQ